MDTNEEIITKQKAVKALLYLGIVSMIMLFAGLTSAYIVRQGEGNWVLFELPTKFYFSTFIIIASSVTMFLSVSAAKKDDLPKIKLFTSLTLALGLAFVWFQLAAWNDLVSSGIFFTGKQSNASGAYLYVLSGAHLAHLSGGIIALTIVVAKSFQQKYNSNNLQGLQLCSIYWHFLDILWVYLFLFFMFVH